MAGDADPPRAGPLRSGPVAHRARQLQDLAGRRLLEVQDRHVTARLLADTFREDRDAGGALLAGALAFRLFLWLLPAGLVVVALLGFSSAEQVSRALSGSGLGGVTTSTIAQAAEQAQQGRWVLLVVGVAGLWSTSVDLARVMWIGTGLAWHLPVSRLRRLPQAGATVVALLLPTAALTLAVGWLRSVDFPLGLAATLLMVLVYTGLGWFVLTLLPRPANTSVVDLLPGALLIGVGLQALHLVTSLFLVNRISSSSQLYGAFGAAATLLFWGYLLARILIGASTLNHTLFRYRDVTALPDRVSPDDRAAGALSVRSLPARIRADWHDIVRAVGHPGRITTTRIQGTGPARGPKEGTGTQDTESVATLTLWRFDDEAGAEAASRILGELERTGALRLLDAAVVTWPAGARRPRGSPVLTGSARGALGGSFWGLLLGIIFFAPLLGLAVGAATGALGGSLRDAGISDAFIREARDAVTPGTSALFVMTTEADVDRVRAAFADRRPTLIHTNLTPEQDAALRQYFSA
ncbi:MAG TPA: YhjD/YihY/BrkB family envelope integrity protein [Terrabacter sp.]|nr:YhjD/YihY/BrkB family envelope integrity protein [Terrabacter sp.]